MKSGIKIASAYELAQRGEKQEAAMRKAIYIDPERKVCVVNKPTDYEVPLNQLNTPAKLLRWVLHLNSKTWMSKAKLDFFAKLILKHLGKSL